MTSLRFFYAFFVGLLLGPILLNAQSSASAISSVGFMSSNLQRSAVFYRDLLGYRVTAYPSKGVDSSFGFFVNETQHVNIFSGLKPDQDERFVYLAFEIDPREKQRDEKDPDGHRISFVHLPSSLPHMAQSSAAISDRIMHVGLIVRDTLAADEYYKFGLGFNAFWRGGPNDSTISWVNLRVPRGKDYIEYMITRGTPTRQQLGSSHHIALMVPDMQKALDILRPRAAAIGYKLAEPRIGRNKHWQLNLFDPDGTRIELMEPFEANVSTLH